MGEEGAKGGRKKKGEREKRTRAMSNALGRAGKGNIAEGGSQSFCSHFKSFALLSLCFGMLTGLNPALRWENSPYQLSKLFESYFIKTVLKITRFLVQIRARARFIFSKKMNFFSTRPMLDNAKVHELTSFKIGH